MAIVLGIIGGGQLGMMLAEAAKKMPDNISEVVVLDPTLGCPAAQIGVSQIVANFDNYKAIKELAKRSDIITYEIESGNADALESVSNIVQVSPSPDTLRTLQDKYIQKQFLHKHDIPVGKFSVINSIDDVYTKAREFGFPVLLKARYGAYDGRGNYLVDSESCIEKAYEYFSGKPVYMERHIDFDLEVSVIAARNTKGEIKTYPLVENIHKDGILCTTVAPARTDSQVAQNAEQISHMVMENLKGAGVFGIEMFVTSDRKVLINEIAPRVHNSGHHTLQSSATTQFEQHLRAILGLKLGSTILLHRTVMQNILGPKSFSGAYTCDDIIGDGVYLKMYNKSESRPLRKLGHLNVVETSTNEDLISRVMSINISIKPT
ncbi:MAG: N5-carboxyaminoimidazole ribonucleotide synthase [Cenarchaeum symbiont of Oopsacas minuta]|nr:N5-carboxyaminoimidazole ribonucleotide synthase [Cenarchaeum symbiont of Oopsacas minuta]